MQEKKVEEVKVKYVIDTFAIKKRYVMILLFKNNITKLMVDEQSEKVVSIIQSLNGELDKSEYCEEKELCTKIKGCTHAHFVAIYYYLPHDSKLGASLKELIRKISNMQTIIRQMNLSIGHKNYNISNLKNFKK